MSVWNGVRRWAGAVAVLLGIGASLWAGFGGGDRRTSRQVYQDARRVKVSMQLQRMREAAPPGTPAAEYAGAAARLADGWRSRWFPHPLSQRLTNTFYVGSPTIEVVFRDGRVARYRAPKGRALDPFPAESAAARLGLSPALPIFDEWVGGGATDSAGDAGKRRRAGDGAREG